MARRNDSPTQGTYQRGEDSRRRMIEAAIDVFGRYGFEGASTRMLAEKAKVNLSAIPYYFGGKEGLYQAVVEHIGAQIAARQIPLAEKAGAALKKADLPKTEALELLLEILDTFTEIIVGARDAERWARIVMREQLDPSPAFDILYEGVMKHMHGVCSALVARLLDQPEDDPDTLLRTTAIVGQVLVFRAARGLTFKRLGWESFTEERVRAIQKVVREQVRAILLPDAAAA